MISKYKYGGIHNKEYNLELYVAPQRIDTKYGVLKENIDKSDEKLLTFLLHNIHKLKIGQKYEFGGLTFFVLRSNNLINDEDGLPKTLMPNGLPDELVEKGLDIYLKPLKEYANRYKNNYIT